MIQKVIRGLDSLNRLPEMMEKLGMKAPLIVGSEKLIPRLRRMDPLREAPAFTGYHPNPDLSDAEAGVRMLEERGCDSLISIGGGSAMDTAKAIKAFLNADSPEDVKDSRLKEKRPLPHIALPATAGSGAETTPTGVLYVEGRKISLSHEMLTPEGCVLDGRLLETLPEYHRKSCAMDALAQGIESWWARRATEDSRVNAYLAIRGVLDNLKPYLAGEPHAAQEMLEASYQSGRAISVTRTTAAHAMSYQITKLLGPAHGHACMMTLPILWDMMLEEKDEEETMAELAGAMRLGDPAMGSRLLRGVMADLEMPVPAMPEAAVLDLLTDSVNPERLENHPMRLSREQIRRVYVQAFLPLSPEYRQMCLDIWKYYSE